MPTQHVGPRRPLRADARDNRRRLLEAARDAFIDRGPTASLDEIARRAGTGIATLYRRVPDRPAPLPRGILHPEAPPPRESPPGPAGEPHPVAAPAPPPPPAPPRPRPPGTPAL